jgi:hypothetical protein
MVRRSRRRLVRFALSASLVVLVLAPGRARAQQSASDAAAPAASWRARPVRQGTVSLGGQLLYSALLGGTFSDDFDNGLGAGFNLRYRTGPDAALAVSFEGQNFNVKVPSDSAAGHDKLQFIVTTLDYIKYGATRSRMPRYVTIGVGLAQTRITDNDKEKEYPGDGGVFKVGAGFEYWGWRTLSLELGVRYHGVLLRSRLNHDVEVGLGFNFYTSP